MAVVIKLNGEYVGVTHMSKSEIRSAESAGFTVIEANKQANVTIQTVSGQLIRRQQAQLRMRSVNFEKTKKGGMPKC